MCLTSAIPIMSCFANHQTNLTERLDYVEDKIRKFQEVYEKAMARRKPQFVLNRILSSISRLKRLKKLYGEAIKNKFSN